MGEVSRTATGSTPVVFILFGAEGCSTLLISAHLVA